MVIKYYQIKFMRAASAAAAKATTEAAAAKTVAAADEAAAGPNYKLREPSSSRGKIFYYGGQKHFFVLFKMVKLKHSIFSDFYPGTSKKNVLLFICGSE